MAIGGRWPYGFYTLLRFVVCGGAGLLAFRANSLSMQSWAWIMGAIAIIFNPVVPFGFVREIWSVMDACTAGLIAIASVSIFSLPTAESVPYRPSRLRVRAAKLRYWLSSLYEPEPFNMRDLKTIRQRFIATRLLAIALLLIPICIVAAMAAAAFGYDR